MAPAPSGKILLTIDAGPKAGPGLDLTTLEAFGGTASSVCAARRAASYVYCNEDDAQWPCGCEVRRLGVAGPSPLVLVDVTGNSIPGFTRAAELHAEEGGALRPVARLGASEGGHRGEWGAQVSIHGAGAADLGAAGRWTWIDVMQEDVNVETGTAWARTLWLCGGTTGMACHGVPLKSWWSGWVKGWEELQKAEGGGPLTTSNVPKYALAITLDDTGTLTVTAKTTDVPEDVRPVLGRHALATLGDVKGVRAPSLPEPSPPPEE